MPFSVFGETYADFVEIFRRSLSLMKDQSVGTVLSIFVQSAFTGEKSYLTRGLHRSLRPVSGKCIPHKVDRDRRLDQPDPQKELPGSFLFSAFP